MSGDTTRARRLQKVRRLCESGRARWIREDARLSQEEMAASVGEVSRAAIARWEAGQRRPHGDRALRYLEVLEALEDAA